MAIKEKKEYRLFEEARPILCIRNNQFDRNVQGLGFCCPAAFIRLHIKPGDTISKLSKSAGVSASTFTNQRRWFRQGRVRCLRRERCLAALWLTPGQIKKYDQLLKEELEAKAKLGLGEDNGE